MNWSKAEDRQPLPPGPIGPEPVRRTQALHLHQVSGHLPADVGENMPGVQLPQPGPGRQPPTAAAAGPPAPPSAVRAHGDIPTGPPTVPCPAAAAGPCPPVPAAGTPSFPPGVFSFLARTGSSRCRPCSRAAQKSAAGQVSHRAAAGQADPCPQVHQRLVEGPGSCRGMTASIRRRNCRRFLSPECPAHSRPPGRPPAHCRPPPGQAPRRRWTGWPRRCSPLPPGSAISC